MSPNSETLHTDLARALHQRLLTQDPGCADRFEGLFLNSHPGWTHGPLPPINQQIRALNEFWRLNLGMLQADTMLAREALIDGISPEVWLENFGIYVLPTATEHGLPTLRWEPHSSD